MRLSLKNVYKKPQICGDCSYGTSRASAELNEQDELSLERDLSQPVVHAAGREQLIFWSKEKPKPKVGIPAAQADLTVASYPDSGGFESDQAEEAYSPGGSAANAGVPRKSAEKILEEKLEQCIHEGYEQGKTKAEDECRTMRESAANKVKEAELSLREARQRAKEIIASSETKIVELALAVSERLVRTQLTVAPETVTAIVRETMNMLNGGEQVDLYVNPADIDACVGFSDRLKEEFKEIVKLEVLADSQLPKGSCRIESESGVAEYLIEEEKEALEKTLLQLARKEEAKLIEEDDTAYGKH
ncbi:MAG: FliH/SctL family protein [Dethiobacteria bacterium]|nr:FliH/SctL family protein [Dethiobacteria bacterium]